MAEESKLAVLAALAGNAGLALLKAIATIMTGSAAMLAETLHSVADTGNQALLFVGMRRARRPPDSRHPFGHGKAVYFWALVVSLLLFSVGGAFAIWEGIRGFLHPTERESYAWAWGVLGGAFIFEAASLSVAYRSLRAAKGGQPILEYLRETRDPTLPTVVLEDAAALTSILVAAVGIGIAESTGDAMWDAAASCVIGVVLIGVALFLAMENHSLLLGEAATPRVRAAIRQIVDAEEVVDALVGLHTMHIGPDRLLIALEVEFRHGLTTVEIERAVDRLQRALTRGLPGLTSPRLVLIEPHHRPAGRRAA
jgi:cation diffusion facilitator family transporter